MKIKVFVNTDPDHVLKPILRGFSSTLYQNYDVKEYCIESELNAFWGFWAQLINITWQVNFQFLITHQLLFHVFSMFFCSVIYFSGTLHICTVTFIINCMFVMYTQGQLLYILSFVLIVLIIFYSNCYIILCYLFTSALLCWLWISPK